MTDRPYTDDDLRALAATLHSRAAANTDIAIRPAVESKWGDQLDDEAYDEASDQIVRILDRAADTSAWAVHLGADGLAPSDEHQITLDGDAKPIVRIHFAFEPDMDERMKNALVTGISQAIAAEL
ncbi:hypothetical protein [Streptomyces sp. NBC_00063]|uniref:hypothetical protein n=1 Tax=Streptomyces sp. NBC_00063 TaxID=2975638 RepID=UPI003D72A733